VQRFCKPSGFREPNSNKSKNSKKFKKIRENFPKNTRVNSKMFCEKKIQRIDHLHRFKNRGSSKVNGKMKNRLGPLAAHLHLLTLASSPVRSNITPQTTFPLPLLSAAVRGETGDFSTVFARSSEETDQNSG